jgi:hypothetical protein
MTAMLAVLGLLLLFGAPCLFSVWIGTRVRWPVVAFFLAWVTTPFANLIVFLILAMVSRTVTGQETDGTMAIMMPLYGIGTGLVAGIIAAVFVGRRPQETATKPGDTAQTLASLNKPI